MIKKYFLFLVLASGFVSMAQELSLSTGKNLTDYHYKNAAGQSNSNLNRGEGSFYEIGLNIKLAKWLTGDQFTYSFGLVLNQFNASGATASNSYIWNTNYLGLQNALSYTFFTIDNRLEARAKIGCTTATIITGEQFVNTARYDLTKNEEFKGLWLQPNLGLDLRYSVNERLGLALGYTFSKAFNSTTSSEEKLAFINQQIHFGVHIPLN